MRGEKNSAVHIYASVRSILLRPIKALDDYKNVYRPYGNFAARTRIEYQNDLECLIGFLDQSAITK